MIKVYGQVAGYGMLGGGAGYAYHKGGWEGLVYFAGGVAGGIAGAYTATYVKNNWNNWFGAPAEGSQEPTSDYNAGCEDTVWPTRYRKIPPGGEFGAPRPYGPHSGVDIRNPLGEPVYATHDGIVLKVWYDPNPLGGGNQIQIYNTDWSVSGYAHTASLVREGDIVSAGQLIGYSNGSGAGAPHLHYTFRPCLVCDRIDPTNILY